MGTGTGGGGPTYRAPGRIGRVPACSMAWALQPTARATLEEYSEAPLRFRPRSLPR